MAYYENPMMLREQLRHLAGLSEKIRSRVQLILVDDGSPKHPAWHQDIGMAFELYRMKVDVRWNQDACRNLGAHHAKSKWLLLTDMDHMVPPETFEGLLSGDFMASTLYGFSRVSAPRMTPFKPHPNSWFLSRALYGRIGGYDERFAGYYGTDGDFRERGEKVAGKMITLPLSLIRVPREVVPDASTTAYTRKTEDDLANFRRIRSQRSLLADQRPLNLQFPWERVA
jgi:hypothetical protein